MLCPACDRDLPKQMQGRMKKRARLRELKQDPYPPAHTDTNHVHDVLLSFAHLEADSRSGQQVRITGRVMRQRDSGGVCFVSFREGLDEIQLILSRDVTPDSLRDAWRAYVDLGDCVVVEGEVVTTRRGTLSVQVASWKLTAKALRPLPGKYRNASSVACLGPRHRYQEMLLDNRALDLVLGRAAVLRALRDRMYERDFVEVDTPLLQPVHGGAASRPFATWMNAWRAQLYLRITSELYLKRLVVGGLARVFEISRAFRNEGVDALHFPEFTLFEACAVHTDFLQMADLVEDLVRTAVVAASRGPVVQGPGDHSYDSRQPFVRGTMYELLSQDFGMEVSPDSSRDELVKLAKYRGIRPGEESTAGALAYLLYRKVVQPSLIQPTFVLRPPVEAAIFARSAPLDENIVDAWSLVVFGVEIGQGCSELTDPVEQRRRLVLQAQGASGAFGVAPIDEDFLMAIEHGLPPVGGFAIGVERLLMVLYGTTRLRDHQVHPITRPARPAKEGL